jgi:hypothetical protein
LRNAYVEVRQGATTISICSTDDFGLFLCPWSSSNLATAAVVNIFMKEKNGRFQINNTSGSLIGGGMSPATLVSGTTSAHPQEMGLGTFGSSASPDWPTNLFYMAEYEYQFTFSRVGALVTNFTNVEIRAPSPSVPGFLINCGSSCASGSLKRVLIDSTDSVFAPQARILHELGHISDYLLNPYHYGANFCWPNTAAPDGVGGGTPCGWSSGANNPEFAAVSFEEGFATFSGDNTLWAPGSVHPTSCKTSTTCPVTASTDIEQSNFPFSINNCSLAAGNPESRWPLSVMRFIWDIYDDHNDCDGDTIAAGNTNFASLYTNLMNYPAGTGFDQIDEPWDASLTTIDNRDGRAGISYMDHYSSAFQSVILIRTDNCGPL